MEIFYKNKWIGGLMDYTFPKSFNSKKVRVIKYFIIAKADDQYIEFLSFYSRLWKVYNYIWIYGLKDTLIKISSRLNESVRNDKYLCCGYGKVDEESVFFVAPNHQYGHDEIVLPSELLFEISSSDPVANTKIYDLRPLNLNLFSGLKGFSFYSGQKYSSNIVLEEIKLFKLLLKDLDIENYQVKNLDNPAEIFSAPHISNNSNVNNKGDTNCFSALLFGYGNYAKTIVVPYLFKRGIKLKKIHEIDPTQFLGINIDVERSTNPFPDKQGTYHVWVIAGFHHTHTEIALEGLKQGAIVVIEKPLSTNHEQFEDISKFIKSNNSIFYLCFQKRYSAYNDFIFQDLKINRGDTLQYYSIVYEEALGENHWYNWPNSQSRIISNGCHWIDHFLYLNNYHSIRSYDASFINVNDIIVNIVLENNSTFVLIISDSGSKRLGVREYIRISNATTTIEIKDNQFYSAENNYKIIRKKKYFNKLHNLKRMYKEINAKILKGESGDSYESLQSSLVCIKLNDLLKSKKKLNETTHPVL